MLDLSMSYLKYSKILALTNCHTAHQVSNGLFLLSALARIVMLAFLLFTIVKIKG